MRQQLTSIEHLGDIKILRQLDAHLSNQDAKGAKLFLVMKHGLIRLGWNITPQSKIREDDKTIIKELIFNISSKYFLLFSPGTYAWNPIKPYLPWDKYDDIVEDLFDSWFGPFNFHWKLSFMELLDRQRQTKVGVTWTVDLVKDFLLKLIQEQASQPYNPAQSVSEIIAQHPNVFRRNGEI
jgi:hypothetical protein